MALHIRQGRPAEWQEILDVSYAAFGKDKRYFPLNWPHTYPDKTAAEWFVVCEEDGKLLGIINQTPVAVNVGGALLKAVGIGGVGVLEEARRRGVMSAMLQASNAEQRAAGTVLGFLAGERIRYRRHGYEFAGRSVTASFSPKHLAGAERVPLRRLRIADASDILRLHRKAPMFVRRTELWQRQLLRRRNFVAWGNKSGPLKAYLVTPRGSPAHVCELIGGAPLLPGLLKAQMKRHKLGHINVRWLPDYGPHLELGRNAGGLSEAVAQQVGIYDFARFLTQTAKPLGEGFRRFGITVPVRIEHTGEKIAFDLKPTRSGALSITPAKGKRKADLALGAAEWVRMFFPPPGGPMLEQKAGPHLIAALALPLNISSWGAV
ncbi:MAG: GNAT family N-acetyltransferase [Planctomycetota bacterium]